MLYLSVSKIPGAPARGARSIPRVAAWFYFPRGSQWSGGRANALVPAVAECAASDRPVAGGFSGVRRVPLRSLEGAG